ncbi:MAG: CHRD domain-containing protein, partial [bacterium]
MIVGVFEAVSNTFTLTPELLTALQERRLYANVHTTTFGGGEIRGQILPITANAFRVNFSGGNEVPPVPTTGAGALMLELVDNQLTISGSFNSLGSDFNAAVRGGAHLHLAPIGRNGGIQIELAATVNADNRSGTFEAAGNTFTLSGDLVTALRTRTLYANIHTQTFGGGEMRGQVLPENYSFFTAALSARNEVQPVASTANGGVIVELSGPRMTLTGSFSGLISDFNPTVRGGAHLHAAPAGQYGGIQIEIATALDANARGGVFEAANNTFMLTSEQITTLRAGGMYANVHTQTFGGGETRGQLLADPNRFPNATTITSPASGSTVVIEGPGQTLLQATWNAATDPDNNLVVYLWQLAADRLFNTPLVNRNTNTATSFAASYGAIDSILAAAGVPAGGTIKLYHRAITSDGSLQSTSPTDSVNLTRGVVADLNFTAILTGDQEVPPVSTPARGQVTAALLGNQLVVTGSFSNLGSDFNAAIRGGAHLHLAPAGRNGGIQIELAATVNADNRSGSFEAANNTFTLTPELITALNERKLYANIHTQTYPGGEIRGQLVPAADAYYRDNLAGSNEVPAVSSTGNGTVILELRGDELTVSGSFKELGSDFNPNVRGGAHIHLAPAGQNGAIQLEFTTVADADLRGGVF